MVRLDREQLIHWLKYLFVGGSSAVLELALFQCLVLFSGLVVEVCNVFAVVVATLYNFLLNRSWAFNSTEHPVISFIKYILLFAFNTTFSTVAISFFTNIGVPAILVKIATMGCIVMWNYFIYKKFIFLK